MTEPWRPELVVGLVGAAGTKVDRICEVVSSTLGHYGYEARELRLSGLMHAVKGGGFLSDIEAEDERMTLHMDAGDAIRKESERNDAVAGLAVAAIFELRNSLFEEGPAEGQAIVLNSLKHPEEVDLLRNIYRNRFVLISGHSPTETRFETLRGRIAASRGEPQNAERFDDVTRELMRRDEEDEGKEFGQHLRDTFTLADVFVSAFDPDLTTEVERYFRLFFSYPFETPTRVEYGMFLAHAAAMRSADLSRQVGAAIANADGEVIALGCNDVPRSGGGQYWAREDPDWRDFQLGYDSNTKSRDDALRAAFDKLSEAGQLAVGTTSEDFRGAIGGTRLGNITEFGRPVHAEMSAILDAARHGISVKGTTLYTTTFPCHNCARHIIGAGIKTVVYREPYEKSLASDLHEKEMEVDPSQPDDAKVLFRRFVGIGPSQFERLFSMPPRKDEDGNKAKWEKEEAEPRLIRTESGYIRNEEDEVRDLSDAIAKVDLDDLRDEE